MIHQALRRQIDFSSTRLRKGAVQLGFALALEVQPREAEQARRWLQEGGEAPLALASLGEMCDKQVRTEDKHIAWPLCARVQTSSRPQGLKQLSACFIANSFDSLAPNFISVLPPVSEMFGKAVMTGLLVFVFSTAARCSGGSAGGLGLLSA